MEQPVLTWARWRDEFAAILDPRFYTLEWLDEEIGTRRAMLLSNERAAVLVTIKNYPTGAREIHGLAAVGDLDEIRGELIPAAEELGRMNGCIVAGIESREGWAKVLKPDGYVVHQTHLRKEL